jgi:mannose-6-phosphate isomerase-like protein (cupin superfamily)
MWGRRSSEARKTSPTPASVAHTTGEGHVLNVLGAPYVLKATSAETGNRFCCIECTVPPGSGVPPHTHEHEDEAFYVLAGEIILDSADRPAPLRFGTGSFFFGPRGCRHAFRNEGSADARMLVFCTPGAGIERMFTDMDAAGRRSRGAPPMEEIVAIAARAGVAIAPPPAPPG